MTRDRYRGALLGLAVGDALGAQVEFKPRGTFPPVTEMLGGGPWKMVPGGWTDDTSMALCLAESLIECETFNAQDQMDRYCRWYAEGYMSHTGSCFDIGTTTHRALMDFMASGIVYAKDNPRTAGNGCIMRLAPIVLFYAGGGTILDRMARLSAETTHSAAEAGECTMLMARLMDGHLKGLIPGEQVFGRREGLTCPSVLALADGRYRSKTLDAIKGSGYVVESLEAALWCIEKHPTFESAVLAAVNLGDDADTTAAIAGQLAGAYYGEKGIPARWLDTLVWRDRLTTIADKLFALVTER